MRSNFSFSRRPEREEKPLTYEESLRFDLRLAKWELDNAYAGFDYATEPDLIDCYIFKLNAAMKRYKYLLEKFNALQKEAVVIQEAQLQADRQYALQTADSEQAADSPSEAAAYTLVSI